jgi:hypothetical protein
MTLREAIEAMIDNEPGVFDAGDIADRIIDGYDSKWLLNEFKQEARNLIADRVSWIIRARRRKVEYGQSSPRIDARPELAERVHVPGTGLKLIADLTAADCLVRAAFHRRLLASHAREAKRLEDWAALIKKHKVARLGDLPDRVYERIIANAEDHQLTLDAKTAA